MGYTRVEQFLGLIVSKSVGCRVFQLSCGIVAPERFASTTSSIVALHSSEIKLDGYEGEMSCLKASEVGRLLYILGTLV